MPITDTKVRPIRNGFLVSYYEQPKPTKKNPYPRGEHTEEFFADSDSAAKRHASLLAKMQKKKSDSMGEPMADMG
jgi:hypothetical protein